MDWRQLWEICSAPDNVPIVGMIPLLAFYIYLAWKQAKANDELVAELETNPSLPLQVEGFFDDLAMLSLLAGKRQQ